MPSVTHARKTGADEFLNSENDNNDYNWYTSHSNEHFLITFSESNVILFFTHVEVYGEYVSGSINDEQRTNVLKNSCPGAGSCGGMYTANTMASAIEAMGMSLPYSSSTLAEDPLKLDECRLDGKYILAAIILRVQVQDLWKDSGSADVGRQRIRLIKGGIVEGLRRIKQVHVEFRPKIGVRMIMGMILIELGRWLMI